MYDLQVQRNSSGRQHAAQTLSEILYCWTKKKKNKGLCECFNEPKRSESQQGEFALKYHRSNFAEPKMFAGANTLITAAGLTETGTQEFNISCNQQ